MNDYAFQDGITREEILVGRVTDGEASPNDWAELQRLAQQDQGVLVRLAEAQRMHAALEQSVEDRIAICELIEARAFAPQRGVLLARLATFTGWAAAAALGVMWWSALQHGGPVTPASHGGTTIASNATPSAGEVGDDGSASGARTVPAFESFDPDTVYAGYLDSGAAHNRVVGVMPNEMINYTITENGQFEVYIVRRVVERRVYDDLKQLDQRFDDVGNAHMVIESVPARVPRGAL